MLPVVTSPDAGAVLTHSIPAFEWRRRPYDAVEGLPEYVIRISTDADGANVVDEDSLPAVLGWYVPDKKLAPGEYWWRVGEAAADGGHVEWSAARRFSVRVPAHVVTVPKTADFGRIQAAVAEAAAKTSAVVRFEAGDYRLDPGDKRAFIELTAVDDLAVDGGGASFVFTRPVALAHLTACRRVLLENFSFDLDPPASSAGRVVAVDRKEGWIEAEILPGHPLPDAWPAFAGDSRGLVVTPDEHFAIKRGAPLVIPHSGFERLEGRRFRFRFANPRLTRALSVGDVYVLDPRWNADGGDGAVVVAGGEDAVLHGITIRSTANECFTSRHATRHAILHVRLERPPGRAIPANNGGNNHHNDRLGPWIEGCLFENCGDDVCHVNGIAMSIAEQPAPDRLVFRRRQLYDRYGDAVALDLRVGDRLVAFQREAGRAIAKATILSTNVTDATVEVTLDTPWAGIQTGDLRTVLGVLKPASRKTGVARAVPTEAVSMPTECYNLDRMCNQFVFRHNIARHSRRIGVLVKGEGGLVEHNLFENLGGGGVEIMNTPFEGLAAVNYVIRDNVIRDCGRLTRDDAGIQAMLFKSGGDRLHRNLLITGNEIINFSGPGIWLKDAENALISGNRLEWRSGEKAAATPDEPIVLGNTEGIRLENNTIE
ncbi:MAG: right-handed parallel beta-helix repeat-containing protein [Planctomycetota bacterium]